MRQKNASLEKGHKTTHNGCSTLASLRKELDCRLLPHITLNFWVFTRLSEKFVFCDWFFTGVIFGVRRRRDFKQKSAPKRFGPIITTSPTTGNPLVPEPGLGGTGETPAASMAADLPQTGGRMRVFSTPISSCGVASYKNSSLIWEYNQVMSLLYPVH